MLDVVDLHNYPYYPSDEAALQLHRVYYDETYDYPGANGLKTINGGWDNTQTKEYIFKRINNWLDQYFGADHGIKLGLSEWSPGPSDPNLASVIYASHLGLFGNNGVDFLLHGMVHRHGKLCTCSAGMQRVTGCKASSLENTVSAYTM